MTDIKAQLIDRLKYECAEYSRRLEDLIECNVELYKEKYQLDKEYYELKLKYDMQLEINSSLKIALNAMEKLNK